MKDVIRSFTTLVTFLAGAQHVNAGVLGPRQLGGCAIGSFYSYDVSSTLKNQLGDPVTSDWNCVGTSGITSPSNGRHATEAFTPLCHELSART